MSFKNYFKIFLLVSIFLFVGSSVSAFNFDSFDTYNDGNLNGQGGWIFYGVGEDNFEVQATTTQGGSAKAVKLPQSTGNPTIKKFLGLENGSIVGWLQDATSSTTTSIGLYISGETSVVGELWFNNTGNIDFWGNTGETILSDYSPDTWYKVEIEWRDSDGYLRARANDGTWSSWLEPQGTWLAINYVVLSSGGGVGYWDTLTYEMSIASVSIPADFVSSTLAYAGDLFTDLNIVIVLAIGLPIGFWIIRKVISLVRVR